MVKNGKLIRETRRWIFVCVFFFCSTAVFAQKQTDFSGTWVLDNAKSDPNYSKYYNMVTCVIRQTSMITEVIPPIRCHQTAKFLQ